MSKVQNILKFIADGSTVGRSYTEIQRFAYAQSTGKQPPKRHYDIRGFYATNLQYILSAFCVKRNKKYVINVNVPMEAYIQPYKYAGK